ncbi:hypothetical protein [Echinimonas agarilytica]|uniref:Uncharacterized protein n=1 Tax=Echinimonas agarilytica TaxID=1215918 RepID=A0AA41W6R9_9GAMM|nr:hypothetical protein [Echinimonas agarilytica]MCM2679619.1 hypothetical protein [Echinimonas agarilytica]
MYFIAAFGFLMLCLSSMMIIRPQLWADGIVQFSRRRYFHWFEVLSRLAVGAMLVVFHSSSIYPQLIKGMGYVLITVSVGLVLIGANKHRQFAVWSARKFQKTFRIAGAVSFMFGLFLMYISIAVTF